jgi:alkylated DNA nucleotide flippase Atl1
MTTSAILEAEGSDLKPSVQLSEYERLRTLADARLAEAISAAYAEHARTLRSALEVEMPKPPDVKGRVQRRMFSLRELFTERGLSAIEIAKMLDYDEGNVYTVLSSLEKGDHIEQVRGATPRRYRMTAEHRRNRILRLSRLVPEGRWTTYGDFSIAVYDNWRMAIAIGQVAAHNPAFANPHRVIWSGGVVKSSWRSDDGRGPEECLRRLKEEGVNLINGEIADPSHFIGWQELKELLDAEEAQDRLDEVR